MPALLRPVLASNPASTTVTYEGPSSCSASRTTTVSVQCGFQSQFWPISGCPPAVPAGSTANAVHSPAAWRATAANMTSVRTLIARTSSTESPAPSAIPAISSR